MQRGIAVTRIFNTLPYKRNSFRIASLAMKSPCKELHVMTNPLRKCRLRFNSAANEIALADSQKSSRCAMHLV